MLEELEVELAPKRVEGTGFEDEAKFEAGLGLRCENKAGAGAELVIL